MKTPQGKQNVQNIIEIFNRNKNNKVFESTIFYILFFTIKKIYA